MLLFYAGILWLLFVLGVLFFIFSRGRRFYDYIKCVGGGYRRGCGVCVD